MTRRQQLLLGGALAVAAVIATVLVLRARATRPLAAIPPERASEPASHPRFDDFAGADACADCHSAQHSAWRASTHGRAGGTPSRAMLLPGFDGRPIQFRDARVTPRIEGGRHAFVVAWNDRPARRFVVEGVVGGGHMQGGGTQGFLTRYDDGTLRFLPFELIRRENTWFCNTNTRLNRGWLPITDSLRLADCGDWPPVRVFGNIPRFANCQECHGSQIDVSSETARPFDTRYQSLAIDCESCHGPGRRHIAMVRAGADTTPDIGMQALRTVSKDASIAVCFRCHALKDGLEPGYLPGRPFDQHYSVKLPLMSEDDPLFSDGRIRTFGYQQGHLYSDCYVSGSMTCVDCHDPHSQQYRDANGRALTGRFDDGQCSACHPSKAVNVAQHTRHPPNSPGSRCVACHMPYLQEPEVGNRLRYARSDHSIPIPRPAFDAALGVEIACQTCHRDRDAARLQAEVTAWWGELKPHPRLVEGLVQMRGRTDRDLALQLLETPAGNHAMAEFDALSRFLTDHLRPDMPSLERQVVQRLERAAMSDDPDLAGVGLAALHYARGNDRRVRSSIVERARTLGASERAVRSRWVIILGFLADRHRERRESDAAVATYRKAFEVRPSDAETLLNLGIALADRQDYVAAEAAYAASLRLEPSNSLTWVNLGIARAARGDEAGAIVAYQDALRVNPFDALAHFNLGNLHLRAGRASEAAEEYRRAVALEPGLAEAHFNLARAAIVLGRLEEARSALRDGLEIEPDNASARSALSEIEAGLRTGRGR